MGEPYYRINEVIISIVMPVHNTGMALQESLESVFMQSFQEFELICVDDCSEDKLTKSILKDFQRKHKNMQVLILDKRVGAAEARNIGFSRVCGEYVIFLDADDIFAHDFLTLMYQHICRNRADLCICGFKEFHTDNGKKCFGNQCILDYSRVNAWDSEEWLLSVPMSPWNKLCKVELLKEKGIRFQPLASCNDVYFSVRVFINAKKRCYLNKPLIFYRTNVKTQISANRNPVNLYKAVMELITVEQQNGNNNPLLLKWSGALLIWSGCIELQNSNNEINNQEFYNLLGTFFRKYKIHFHNKVLNACVENIRTRVYENRWGYECLNTLGQLRLTAEELKKQIKGYDSVYLWGMGNRGTAFQQLCKEQNICLCGVTDVKKSKIESDADYGYPVMKPKDVLDEKGLIVASNKEIYKYLQEKKSDLNIINLEEYCPF